MFRLPHTILLLGLRSCSHPAPVDSDADTDTDTDTDADADTDTDTDTDDRPPCAESVIDDDVRMDDWRQIDVDSMWCVTEITGTVWMLDNEDVRNLDGLSALTRIGGGLYLMDDQRLKNLDGLGALTSVGDFMYVDSNPSLADIHGLRLLESVGDPLNFGGNPSLESLDGLDSLTTINGTLWVERTQFADLAGLVALRSVDEVWLDTNGRLQDVSKLNDFGVSSLLVNDNSVLTDIDIVSDGLTSASINSNPALTSVRLETSRTIAIGLQDNPVLESLVLDGAQSAGKFELIGNPALTTLSAPALETVDQSLYVDTTAVLRLDGFPALTSVGDSLQIANCLSMESMDFPALASVDGDVSLRMDSSLLDLSGLGAVEEVGGDLLVYYDGGLVDLGLRSLTSVGASVGIHDNSLLCPTRVDDLVAKLTSGPTSVTNSGNAGVCP